MTQVKIIVDGKEIVTEEGRFLNAVLEENNIWVPKLCFHEALQPYGVCRICVVEWDRGDWSKIVTSCNFPVKDGQSFKTNSERVQRLRRGVMELILARSSNVPEIVELAKRIGVDVDNLPYPKEDNGCILCGHCIKACEEVVGVSAIGFYERGPKREICSPFMEEANRCIGCGSCVYICPTNYIKMEDKDHVRKIPQWKVEFEMARCKKCGADIAPKKQLEYFKKTVNLPADFYDYCLDCRP